MDAGPTQLYDSESIAAVGRALGPHPSAVTALAVSPDGSLAATGCTDGSIRLWNLETQTPFGPPLGHRAAIRSLAISPDGRFLLSGSADTTARFWDIRTGSPVGPPLRHRDVVYQVGFSPDGRLAVTGSRDQTAQRWQAPPTELTENTDRLRSWAEGLTGQELDSEGVVRTLDEPMRLTRINQLMATRGVPALSE